ncbi:MAG TPA: oligosaccharide flippase family protein [Rhizomicrobium sp.]
MRTTAPKDVVKLLSGSLVAKVFGIGAVMLFARVLPKDQMAIFPAYLMLAGLSTLFVTFGIYAAFVREVPSLLRTDEARARSLVMTGSGVILAGTLIPCVAAWWWSDAIAAFVFKNAAQGWVIRIMVPGFLAYVVSKTADQIMWGRAQFGATSILQILESIVRPVATVALWFWLGYRGIVFGLVIAQFVMAAVAFWCVRDMFLGPLPALYPLRKLFSESMPYYIGNYLSYLRGDGDSILVSFLGPAALAEYYIAKTLFTNMALVWAAVDRVAAERLARFALTESFADKVRALHVRICQMMIPFDLLAIAVAPGALVVLAGARYSNATWPAIILLVAMLVQFISIPYDRAVYVSLSGMIRLKFTILEAVVVVVSAAILVPLAGVTGVAAARIIAPLGVCIFGAWIMRRHLGLVLPLRPMLLALATAAPGAALALVLVPTAHGVASALSAMTLASLIWVSSTVVLAWFLDRPMLLALGAEVFPRYRAAVSSWGVLRG